MSCVAPVWPQSQPARPGKAVRSWSSPAHIPASELGGSNKRPRTAGTTDMCVVGRRLPTFQRASLAAATSDPGQQGLRTSRCVASAVRAAPVRLTQAEGAAVPRASGRATPLYVPDQEHLSRPTASESRALHALAKQSTAAAAEVAWPDGTRAAPSVRAARVWTACGLLNAVGCFSLGLR